MTLFLGTNEFIALEEISLRKANIQAKSITILTKKEPLLFNGLKISLDRNDNLLIQPRGQGSQIELLDPEDKNCTTLYKKMRALGAWIASGVQPPSRACLLSQAAQR
ncbi:hypothetical protein K3495_g7498 [Podosphaera aphanis]|nr:hypothetical protein K3495_g7498 [Podosphaera aphanis]